MAEFAVDQAAVARLEHLFRIPFWPYWWPVLTVLHERNADVVRTVPLVAARLCALWLRTMPLEAGPGRPFPWRMHAALLAFALASDAEKRKEEGESGLDFDEQAYEGALYATAELPDEVSGIALKLARRREEWADVQARREAVERESTERLERLQEEDPERAQQIVDLCTPLFPLGPLRDPWPDGPSERVDEAFRKVCLDTPALVPLMRVRPAVALEVLLAVCIEEPQHEDIFGHSGLEHVGVELWQEGYPPFYTRGPFLSFLREAPNEGLSFVLRVVNFATQRWAEGESRRAAEGGPVSGEELAVTIRIGDQDRCWVGNELVLTWSLGWSVESNVVICALMALEAWLHETSEAGRQIESLLHRIIDESESVAFLGLLVSIGKWKPSLFEGVLRPVLGVWQLYLWDQKTSLERTGVNPSLIPWSMRRGPENDAAREWHTRPYRSILLTELAQRLLGHLNAKTHSV